MSRPSITMVKMPNVEMSEQKSEPEQRCREGVGHNGTGHGEFSKRTNDVRPRSNSIQARC
eukprot:4202648-Pyramimonas_sp.AAC.3